LPRTPPFPTLVDLLRSRSGQHAERTAYVFLQDGEEESERRTYGELDARARALAVRLWERGVMPGDRVLLLFPPGLDFIDAFFGCLYAGVVAVPCYPPRPGRDQPRLKAILEDAGARFALGTAAITSKLESLAADDPRIARLERIVAEAVPSALAERWARPAIAEETLAFLQYTSGSTATPKGVMVTHGNLLFMEDLIAEVFEQGEESVVVGWLPVYHDMGLIGNVLQPLWLGASCVLMSPVAFLRRPRRWLEAIAKYRATTSGGPNFAYELCVERIGEDERRGLDLSSWRVAFNGAEPVRASTLERFADAFAGAGFRRQAFRPCYGLAEATLLVSGSRSSGEPMVLEIRAEALERGRAEAAEEEGRSVRLVGSGRVPADQPVAIVDPETRQRHGDGQVGEIWVRGPGVAAGYWNRPEETAETFGAMLDGTGDGTGPWLRTGDLGFLSDGALFITGRLKDLIILRGRNHYPQDLELTAERAAPGLPVGSGAAFAVEVEGEERLVVVQELAPRARPDAAALEETAAAIRRSIAEEHEVQVYEVLLVKAGTIPKTTSGKIQRRLCRSMVLDGTLEAVGRSRPSLPSPAPPLLPQSVGEGLPLPEDLESWLRHKAAAVLRMPVSEVDPARPLIELGLDSLAAIELGHAAEMALGVALPPGVLLEGASIVDLARRPLTPWPPLPSPPFPRERGDVSEPAGASSSPDHDRLLSVPPLPVGGRGWERGSGGEGPLSQTQRGLWFLHRLRPESTAYHLVGPSRLHGDRSVDQLRAFGQALVDRHPGLRTTFPLKGEEPVRHVHERMELAFEEVDASGWTDERLRAGVEEAAWRPFDLERGPLFRITLFDRGFERILVIGMHHIISDFGSLLNLVQPSAEETAGDFNDFVAWQTEMLQGPEGERLWHLWRERLAGLPELDLPVDRIKPENAPERGALRGREIGPHPLAEIRALARSRGATLYVALLAAFQTLLHRYTGQDDFGVGSPAAGRTAGFGGTFGYFTNPVVLRADLAGDPGFRELLDRTRRRVLEALDHQHFPLPLLIERLDSRAELFRVMFVLHRVPPGLDGLVSITLGEGGGRLRLDGFELESFPFAPRAPQFDVTLAAGERFGALGLQLVYDADRFDSTTAARWLEHLANLIAGAVEHPDRPVSELPLLHPWECQQVLLEVNDDSEPVLPWTLLHEGFEWQAERTPEAVALIDREQRLTYRELRARAAALADHLRGMGVGPETVVGVRLPRTADLVVGLLGVLESGAAYLPLDPAYPEERIEFMVADARAALVIQSATLPSPPDPLSRHPSPPPRERGRGDSLAYLIYTSGSTGRPKGVAIGHAAALRLIAWASRAFSLDELRGVLAATSVSFDLSVFEIFVPLSLGGTVILAENALALPDLPARDEVTLINTVPSAIAALLEIGPLPASVRTVNLAGEPLRRSLAEKVLATGVRLWDLYGPSEDTTYSTGSVVVAGDPFEPLIGAPVAGSRGYVVDRFLRPLPLGIAGELCLGGGALARGYLGRPELTAEKFIPDPFSGTPGARVYRTGDLVKRRFDGVLDYLGRIDHQVKIRGFRIELGEIEAALLAVSWVRETVVVARDGALAAYVALTDEPPARPEEALRESLRQRLPAVFVPAVFMVLDVLPRTPNGKVDRKALPEPRSVVAEAGSRPRGPIEEMLAAIWAGVLGLPDPERIGPDDSFFMLGGHSLIATRVMARIRESFGVGLPLRDLFDAPTLAGLARRIEQARGAGAADAEPIPRAAGEGLAPLSFAQQRLWFLDRLEPGTPLYNMPAVLRAVGPLDVPILSRVFAQIEQRHEALRTVFPLGDSSRRGEPVQEVRPPAPFSLPVVDLAGLPDPVRGRMAAALAAEEARRPFDLARGPVWRGICLRLGPAEHHLLLTLHHIAGDRWSFEILEREVGVLYRGGTLPELPAQYSAFTVWQRERLSGEALERDLAWWRERLAGAEPLDLPGDRPRPAASTSRGLTVEIPVPARLAAAVRSFSRERGTTLYLTMLAGFAALLARWSGQRDLCLGSPVAGRSRTEVEDLIGLFVNTLVLRIDLAGDPGLPEILARTRDALLGAHAHGEVPFERLVQELLPERTLGRSPLIQTLFDLAHAAPIREWAPGLRLERLPMETGTAKLDLSLQVEEAEGGLFASLEAAADLYDRTTGLRLLESWLRLLAGAVEEPDLPLSALPLLSAAEEAQVVREWNGTAAPWPRDLCLHHLFQRQVRERPEATALIGEGFQLTYRELAGRVDSLVGLLAPLGVGPEAPVAFCLERHPGRIAALLAILQAGGAYVPLDPAWPAERLAWVLEDCGAPLLLTEESLHDRFDERADGPALLLLDASGSPSGASVGSPGLQPRAGASVTASNAACIIYTSGSTGRPKGVVLEHRSLIPYVLGSASFCGVGPEDRLLHFASIGFDLSIEEIFVAFATGATLVLASPEMGQSAAAWLEGARRWDVTTLHPPTALWHEAVREVSAHPGVLPPSLRSVVIGGEAALSGRVAEWCRAAGARVRLFNSYGPTETGVSATVAALSEGVLGPFGVPIGRPIPGARVAVTDRGLWPVPPGVPGELCIGGLGMARGYLRRADLTAERFVPDPFAQEPGARLYRTGDLVRFRGDGLLEFLGRFDDQVKIRGFRIEPGEVEAALAACPMVAEAAVLVAEDGHGGRRLVAFVVPAPGREADAAELRDFMKRRLPDYMVPAAFAVLGALPLTAGGKVDRIALARIVPAPGGGGEGGEPRTPVEQVIATVWNDLLGAGPVSRQDSFFDLGGHSLLAARVGARLRDAFGVDVPVRDLFEEPTLAGLAARVEARLRAREGGGAEPPLVPLTPEERAAGVPLSFAQRRLWFFDRLEPGSPLYNIHGVLRVTGPLDADRLERALGAVERRHESLRTVFAAPGDEPVQIILPPRFTLRNVDLTGLPAEEREARAWALAAEEAVRPFDLDRGPLWRAALLRLGEDDHRLLLTIHHVVSDGWSLGILLREVAALYEQGGAALPPLPVQYADWAVWQQRWLQGEVLESGLAAWRGRLAGAPPLLELPTDRPRPAIQAFRGAYRTHLLPAGLATAAGALARREGATLFMVLLAAFQSLLARWSGQRDLVIGTPDAGRSRIEVEGLIGFFVNTLPLRVRFAGDPPFRELMANAREVALAAYAHREIPFERLVEDLAPERDRGHAPLVQVVLSLQNTPDASHAFGGLTLTPLESGGERSAKFDLLLAVEESADGLATVWEYDADLFDDATIRGWTRRFEALLTGALLDPDHAFSTLPLLSWAESETLVFDWSGAARANPTGLTLTELFAEQVALRPEAVAVVSAAGELTYAELNARADLLAKELRSQGVGPEVRVGLLMDRSVEVIVAILGVLKAGGAYVPLDPSWPEERRALILADTEARVVLPLTPWPPLPSPSVRRERGDVSEPAGASSSLSHDDLVSVPPLPVGGRGWERGPGGEGLAYVMYTSGSTGRPKGVEVSHQAVARLVRGASWVRLGPEETLLLHSPLTFDASTLEIWGALANGGRLVVPPAGPLSPRELGGWIARHGVTTVWLTAALFHQMVDEHLEGLRPLRQLLAGGDVLSPPHVESALAAWPDLTVINGYGPTESTTFTTVWPMGGARHFAGSVPIGRPIDGTLVRVLDEGLELAATGSPGELCAGGRGLARGYLGRPDLTAERFVPDPLAGIGSEAGARLYRTGDLARWRPDREGRAALEFLGRIDRQVKVRGFRIEPGEIEAALETHTAIHAAAVVAPEDRPGERRLVAWITTSRPVSAEELREHLRHSLPAHMVPSAFHVLGELPLTAHDKVDRRALERLRPEEESAAVRPGAALPRGPVEEMVTSVWAGILDIPAERIGLRDDFFALGGHSLLATRIGTRLREAFGVDLPLRDLLERPTVEAMARRIEDLLRAEDGSAGTVETRKRLAAPPIAPAPRDQDLPLSFAQQRLWLIDQLEPGLSAYNVTLALRLRGSMRPDLLAGALTESTRRHEAMRTTFAVRADDPVQLIGPAAPVLLPVIDLSSLPETVREGEAGRLLREEEARPFDLARGPLLRAGLLRLASAEHILLVAMHHIVCDEWSLRLLFAEVIALYTAFRAGRPSPLPELPVQYADFAAWQRSWLSGPVLGEQLAFWRRRLAQPPVLELPTDRPRPPLQTFRGTRLSFALPPETSAALLALGRARGATAFMTLLAAFEALLARTAGQTDLTVGTPITGRSRIEVEDLVGFFLNTLVLRADLTGDPGFNEIVGRARERSLEAFAHQDLPFEKLVDELGIRRSLGHSPLFQTLFVLLHAAPLSAEAAGLRAELVETGGATAKFDLTLSMQAEGDLLAGVLEANADLFDETTALRLAERFRVLCAAAARDPERPLSDLPLLPEAEAHQIALEWNDRPPGYDREARLHELIAAQAEREPERTALEWAGGSWTYADLVGRARNLAGRLRSLGVGPDVPVGVLAGRGPELAVALLAIFEADGAYMSIDPDYPRDRQVFMLEDSRTPVVLVPEPLAASLPETSAHVLLLNQEAWAEGSPSPGGREGDGRGGQGVRGSHPEQTAYVIYTSGSTGKPKGILVPHRVLSNVVLWQIDPDRPWATPEPARTLQFSSPSFDVSLQEILSTWCTGGTVVLITEEERRDPERLAHRLADAEVERLFLPYVALQQLADRLARPDAPVPARLRRVFTAGEQPQVTPQVIEAFRKLSSRTGGTTLHNHYGPSETHVMTEEILAGDPGEWPRLPSMGRPISGTTTMILDRALRPLPIGIPGELALGGVCPARGYLNRPELTADKFIPDAWSGVPGARLYRSGDLARLLADGRVEFLGRIDHQVKIRGYRIELGEIEAVLGTHPRVRECAAGVREDRVGGAGDRRLVAWVVLDGEATGGEVPVAELRDHLRARLPDYMIPAVFLRLDALPQATSGKVLRSALPAPEGERQAAAPYVEPGTALEREIAAVLRGVLGLDRVGREDNFFDLGGHSLTMVRAANGLSERLGRPVAVLDLFRTPTVASLARQLGGEEEEVPAREVLEKRAETRRQSLGRLRELRRGR
jgi:amino acid adenylation domain-containing protein